MRKIAALSFLILTGSALLMKLTQEPRTHYALTVSEAELTPVERAASAGASIDDIHLEGV